NQGYRGEADLTDITSIALQATSELDHLKFSLAQPVFIKQVALEFGRIHPDSLRAANGEEDLKRGRDFDVDLERGLFWMLRDIPDRVEISYRHGGGTVRLLPGRYAIPEGGGIELRSYCTLDLRGASLIAAKSY